MKKDRAQARADYALKAARAKRAWARRLWAKYGITPEQYQKMLDRQGGLCDICYRPPKTLRLAVDHDHKTKRVRGLLCYTCNRFRVSRNTVQTASRVLQYLESTFDGRNL